jgi:hypothetical protein
MSTGSRLVLGFLLFATFVFAALQIYGGRSLSRREPDTPAFAAREAAQADNTLVGMLGGVLEFHVVAIGPPADSSVAATRLEARIVGARDNGRLLADLAQEDGRWKVRSAVFTFADGRTIPIAGSAGR